MKNNFHFGMLDFIKMSIEIKRKYQIINHQNPDCSSVDMAQMAALTGLSLTARSVEWEVPFGLPETAKPQQRVYGLSHPWDSLPSSFSGIAFKLYQGGKLCGPRVELKCSPAKIMQGHNVYGSDSLEVCCLEILANLEQSLPRLFDVLDVKSATLDWIDCTFSARTPNQNTALQCIKALKNISVGQIKANTKAGTKWDSTVYWNQDSEVCERKAYIKEFELDKDFANLEKKLSKLKESNSFFSEESKQLLRRKNKLSPIIDKLRDWSQGLIRFEVRLKQKKLQALGVPRRLFDACHYQYLYELQGRSLIYDLWFACFKDLFKAFEGAEMNIYNQDEVHEKLRAKYHKTTPKGNISYAKANRLFDFYSLISTKGYETIQKQFDDSGRKSTFYDNRSLLLEAGISLSQLQQFNGSASGEVIPLIQLLKIDFNQQLPDWAPPCVSQFDNLNIAA